RAQRAKLNGRRAPEPLKPGKSAPQGPTAGLARCGLPARAFVAPRIASPSTPTQANDRDGPAADQTERSPSRNLDDAPSPLRLTADLTTTESLKRRLTLINNGRHKHAREHLDAADAYRP
ncbi:hypothetical protein, partial [Aquabacterium humicola]|uniref:hypothetical protein n=1 Tax=Aquabacterium humicola TaxID=3237377 RepID=UPI002543D77B